MDRAHGIVLFGGWSRFTEYTLRQLLQQNIRVQSVVLDGFGPSSETFQQTQVEIHRSNPSSILEVCNGNNIPFHCFSDPRDFSSTPEASLESDIFLLSCYPRRLPLEVASLAHHACINIHPSLLPKYRGSNPIFWQIRNAETQTGVTLHEVSEQIDAGAILARKNTPYPQGARLADIERKLIENAVDCLHGLLAVSYSKWERIEQKDDNSTWFASPCDDDFVISIEVDAQKALNFIRAYARENRPIAVKDGVRTHRVIDAIRMAQRPEYSVRIRKNMTEKLRFSDGRLLAFVQQF